MTGNCVLSRRGNIPGNHANRRQDALSVYPRRPRADKVCALSARRQSVAGAVRVSHFLEHRRRIEYVCDSIGREPRRRTSFLISTMPENGQQKQVAAALRVAVVGGCGHIGLPLGLLLCDRGHTVTLVDVNAAAVKAISEGKLPFYEQGAEELLPKCLASGRLKLT